MVFGGGGNFFLSQSNWERRSGKRKAVEGDNGVNESSKKFKS